MAHSEFTCDCTVIHGDAVKSAAAKMPCGETLDTVAGFFRVLGDGTRLRIIEALSLSELCVCDIAAVLGMTKSAVSHQLGTLRDARLVKCRRDGKTVYYSLADSHVRGMLDAGLEHVHE